MIVPQYARRIDSIALAKAAGLTRTPALRLHIPRIPRPGLSGLGLALPSIYDAGAQSFDDPQSVYGGSALVPLGTTTLNIPGIGPIGAEAIIRARRETHLIDLAQLRALGIRAPEQAAPYILLDGRRPPQQLSLFNLE